MKILQIIQAKQLRGAEIFACQLARELQAGGVTVDFVVLFDFAMGLESHFPDLNFISLGAVSKNRLWDFRGYRKLATLIKAGNYDLVQANAGDTVKYGALSKALFAWKAPLIYRNANLVRPFLKSRLHGILTKWFMKRCSWFISVSENCRQDLIRLFPAAGERSTTITIGTYRFADVKPYELSEKEEIFINIGSFVPEKNHAFLIEVFAAYYEKHNRGHLWLVGDGKLRVLLEELVLKRNLNQRVRFWGYRSDAVGLLKAANVLVMPSRIEGLPGVILEALSCGTPVVASAVGGIPEVINNGVNGFCLEGFSIEEYVRSMEKMTDPEFRERFSENGKRLIEKEFLNPIIAKRFIKAYEKILSGNGR